MSGRINPREYDLGELRDAARERSRHGDDSRRSSPDDASAAPTVSVRPSAPTAERQPERNDGSAAAGDPETYLRSRRRSGWGRGEQHGEHERRDDPGRRSTDTAARTPKRESEMSAIDFLTRRADGGVSKPYLDTLPGAYAAQLEIFEWLDMLVSRAGHDGAVSALEYYESVEWLSTECREELESFVDGLTAGGSEVGSLGVSDHRESLVYIARLAGRR